MYGSLEKFAVWIAPYRMALRILVSLTLAAALVVYFGSDRVVDLEGRFRHPTVAALLGLFALLGVGGFSGQALHIAHWFGPTGGATSQPRIYKIYPHARPAIVLLVLGGFVYPFGCSYLFFYFLTHFR
jgi:hypothetical protein